MSDLPELDLRYVCAFTRHEANRRGQRAWLDSNFGLVERSGGNVGKCTKWCGTVEAMIDYWCERNAGRY